MSRDTEKECIINLYEEGKSTYKIASELNINTYQVKKVLKTANIKLRSRSDAIRTMSLNETVFDVITSESAYWIGFLMADGCVRHVSKDNSWKLSLGLCTIDLEHLEKFKKFIDAGHKICVSHGGRFATIAVSSVKLTHRLMEFGVVPRKSNIAEVKGMLEFNPDFWRGVVDGDGSVGIYKGLGAYGNSAYIYLCGSEKLMQQFKTFAQTVDPSIKNKILHPKTQHYSIKISGPHAIKVLEVLYGNAQVYLNRKYKNAVEIIKNKETLLSGYRKFNEEQIKEIRSFKDIKSQRKVAKMYNTGKTTIAHIFNDDYYHWVTN